MTINRPHPPTFATPPAILARSAIEAWMRGETLSARDRSLIDAALAADAERHLAVAYDVDLPA